MKRTARARLVMFFLSLFLTLSLASVPSAAAQPADLVFRNGAVYTLDAARSWAEAVAVSRGRIVYVGPENGIGSWDRQRHDGSRPPGEDAPAGIP